MPTLNGLQLDLSFIIADLVFFWKRNTSKLPKSKVRHFHSLPTIRPVKQTKARPILHYIYYFYNLPSAQLLLQPALLLQQFAQLNKQKQGQYCITYTTSTICHLPSYYFTPTSITITTIRPKSYYNNSPN